MQGLIFGPVDKNLNELWFCCPVLYRKAWDKAYAQTSDYQRIYPKMAKKTRGDTTAYKLEVADNEGTAKDIVQLWERHYHDRRLSERPCRELTRRVLAVQ